VTHPAPRIVFHRWHPPGDFGARDTAHLMAQLARIGATDPAVELLASGCEARQGPRGAGLNKPLETAGAIRALLTRFVEFRADPPGLELVTEPGTLARSIANCHTVGVDCDDVATLAAAIGLAAGLQARFILAGAPDAPFSHVWAELAAPLATWWIDVDITRDAQGLLPAMLSRRLTITV
jgi:hypothetical protein